jgi:hypothetical protein
MLNQDYFYFGLIRKYTVLMGAILDDIFVQRTSPDGSVLSMVKVVAQLSTKEKMLARLEGDPDIDKPFSVLLPRISFEMTGLQYASKRKLNTVNRRVSLRPGDPNHLRYVYNPVPYDFNFKVVVYAKNQEDVAKIVEQILPNFTPDWTVTLELIPELNISHDIPIVLDMASIEDLYSEDYKDRRVLTWDLEFTMQGYLYGPERTKPIIKFANTSLYIEGSTVSIQSVVMQPGLTANGLPTSVANNSINPLQIMITNNYGYVETILK